MSKQGRHSIKKPRRIAFLAKGAKPRMDSLVNKKPIKIAFLERGQKPKVKE